MNKKEAIDAVNELWNISTKNVKNDYDIKQAYRCFGIGESNVSFEGFKTVAIYQDKLELLYSFNKEVERTISLKKFQASLIPLLRKLRDERKLCDDSIFKNFFEAFLKIEKEESEIFFQLYGVKMERDILELGDYTIYSYSNVKHLLYKKNPDLLEGLFFGDRESDFYLGVKVISRDNIKSVEMADELAEIFENVMNYMVGDLSHIESVGVFNFRGWKNTSRIICNNSSAGMRGISKKAFSHIKIEDPFFTDLDNGNDRIWTLISKSNKSEIEKRLLRSIEWIGKGVNEKDISKALVQFVFAIESMLKYDENSLITPSIVSQFADWLAFILEDDVEERKGVAKYFKHIYGKRSAIVHGGTKTVVMGDVNLALEISKSMIVAFLVTKPFKGVKTIQELSELITNLKFK
ncbi:hypothetical protein G3O08_17170 [Cryomorpha ignava]|uniref:Apea-like HEPN domain-containing protein n=1 Tax=Cryomorpha ignava TaxID=101383 RepID=A0A7K3WU83_9FLAO|nr:HEPN domain-containing protein [Cryomorpha ignava]NEN25230.1 hypothetical protein [Cryomorpha ignava]